MLILICVNTGLYIDTYYRANIEARGDGDWSHWRLTAAVKMSVP